MSRDSTFASGRMEKSVKISTGTPIVVQALGIYDLSNQYMTKHCKLFSLFCWNSHQRYPLHGPAPERSQVADRSGSHRILEASQSVSAVKVYELTLFSLTESLEVLDSTQACLPVCDSRIHVVLLSLLINGKSFKVDVSTGSKLRLDGTGYVNGRLDAQLLHAALHDGELDGDDACHFDGTTDCS